MKIRVSCRAVCALILGWVFLINGAASLYGADVVSGVVQGDEGIPAAFKPIAKAVLDLEDFTDQKVVDDKKRALGHRIEMHLFFTPARDDGYELESDVVQQPYAAVEALYTAIKNSEHVGSANNKPYIEKLIAQLKGIAGAIPELNRFEHRGVIPYLNSAVKEKFPSELKGQIANLPSAYLPKINTVYPMVRTFFSKDENKGEVASFCNALLTEVSKPIADASEEAEINQRIQAFYFAIAAGYDKEGLISQLFEELTTGMKKAATKITVNDINSNARELMLRGITSLLLGQELLEAPEVIARYFDAISSIASVRRRLSAGVGDGFYMFLQQLYNTLQLHVLGLRIKTVIIPALEEELTANPKKRKDAQAQQEKLKDEQDERRLNAMNPQLRAAAMTQLLTDLIAAKKAEIASLDVSRAAALEREMQVISNEFATDIASLNLVADAQQFFVKFTAAKKAINALFDTVMGELRSAKRTAAMGEFAKEKTESTMARFRAGGVEALSVEELRSLPLDVKADIPGDESSLTPDKWAIIKAARDLKVSRVTKQEGLENITAKLIARNAKTLELLQAGKAITNKFSPSFDDLELLDKKILATFKAQVLFPDQNDRRRNPILAAKKEWRALKIQKDEEADLPLVGSTPIKVVTRPVVTKRDVPPVTQASGRDVKPSSVVPQTSQDVVLQKKSMQERAGVSSLNVEQLSVVDESLVSPRSEGSRSTLSTPKDQPSGSVSQRSVQQITGEDTSGDSASSSSELLDSPVVPEVQPEKKLVKSSQVAPVAGSQPLKERFQKAVEVFGIVRAGQGGLGDALKKAWREFNNPFRPAASVQKKTIEPGGTTVQPSVSMKTQVPVVQEGRFGLPRDSASEVAMRVLMLEQIQFKAMKDEQEAARYFTMNWYLGHMDFIHRMMALVEAALEFDADVLRRKEKADAAYRDEQAGTSATDVQGLQEVQQPLSREKEIQAFLNDPKEMEKVRFGRSPEGIAARVAELEKALAEVTLPDGGIDIMRQEKKKFKQIAAEIDARLDRLIERVLPLVQQYEPSVEVPRGSAVTDFASTEEQRVPSGGGNVVERVRRLEEQVGSREEWNSQVREQSVAFLTEARRLREEIDKELNRKKEWIQHWMKFLMHKWLEKEALVATQQQLPQASVVPVAGKVVAGTFTEFKVTPKTSWATNANTVVRALLDERDNLAGTANKKALDRLSRDKRFPDALSAVAIDAKAKQAVAPVLRELGFDAAWFNYSEKEKKFIGPMCDNVRGILSAP